jgi:hypothetical protein
MMGGGTLFFYVDDEYVSVVLIIKSSTHESLYVKFRFHPGVESVRVEHRDWDAINCFSNSGSAKIKPWITVWR